MALRRSFTVRHSIEHHRRDLPVPDLGDHVRLIHRGARTDRSIVPRLVMRPDLSMLASAGSICLVAKERTWGIRLALQRGMAHQLNFFPALFFGFGATRLRIGAATAGIAPSH